MKSLTIRSFSVSMMLFVFVATVFMGVFSVPVFAGIYDEEIKAIEKEISDLSRRMRDLSKLIEQVKKDAIDSAEWADLQEKRTELAQRQHQLFERLQELKLKNNK